MKARTDQAHTVIIGEARSPVGVSLGLRLIGEEEVATVTLSQHDRTVTLYVADQAHAAQIAAAIQGHPPLAAGAPRVEAKATAMTDYQLVPFPPTAEMVEAAADAYMPFGDMELAIRMALLAAPAVQGEPVAWQPVDELRFEYRHPKTGEAYTVSLSREEVMEMMHQELFEKLTACFCECEPIGETNVVDCRCDEYAEQFELVIASLPAEQQPDVTQLVEALEKYESAFDELFVQCCSNPVTNAWGQPVSMAALNDAHAFASSRLATHRKQGGEA